MSLVSFPVYVERQGLSFGFASSTLEDIGQSSRVDEDCSTLLNRLSQNSSLIVPIHVLKIRQAFRTYHALEEYAQGVDWGEPLASRLHVAAARFAFRTATDKVRREPLRGAFLSLVSATLKHGRLRVQARDLSDPHLGDLAVLAGHSESCEEIPPHRFFSVSRGVADGLLWVEVLFSEGEVTRALGPLASAALVDELSRSGAKAVLDALGERAEREVIATAAEALYTLLARPPLLGGAVAGVVTDERRLWVVALDGAEEHAAEMGLRETERLVDWLAARAVRHIGVARVGGRGSYVALIQALGNTGLSIEPVREAGLMKQAKALPRPIKFAAAEVVCRRTRDPLEGYSGIAADELGLGEYLDRVHTGRLVGALEDARQLVAWERARGKLAAPLARGISVSPLVHSLADLRPGMELLGTVANLTHFGAFVEVGLPVQGLIHLSELADRRVAHPSEVVTVGERVRVRVVQVDLQRKRLSLSLRSSTDKPQKPLRNTIGTAKRALEDLFKK